MPDPYSEHVNGHNAAMEAVKSAPPIAVSGMTLLGLPLNEWVLGLTIIWLACQIGGWAWDRFIRGKKHETR